MTAVLGRKGRNTNFFIKLVIYGAHIMGTYPIICGGELAKKKILNGKKMQSKFLEFGRNTNGPG